jgi:tetratricopeptide (TPR) repeat protein
MRQLTRRLLPVIVLTFIMMSVASSFMDWTLVLLLTVVLVVIPTGYLTYVYYGGTSLAMRGDLKGALHHYERVVTFPFVNRALLHARRGALRNALGDVDGAIADYTSAMQVAGREEPAIYGVRSSLYLTRQDYAHALEDSSRLLELLPGSEIGYANRAAARMSLGDVEGAIEDCTTGLNTKGSSGGRALLYNNRGTAYRLKGDYDEAMSNYNLALNTALDQQNQRMIRPPVLTNLGLLYFLMDEYDSARIYFQQAHDANPAFYKAMAALAAARSKLGQHDLARRLLDDLVDKQPRYRSLARLQKEMNFPDVVMQEIYRISGSTAI